MPSITSLPEVLERIKSEGLTTGPLPEIDGPPSWTVVDGPPSWTVVDGPPSWTVVDGPPSWTVVDGPPSWTVIDGDNVIGDPKRVQIPADLTGWADLIGRFNYKPSWEFLADEDGREPGIPYVLFSFWAEDSRGTGERIRVIYYKRLPQWSDPRSAVQALIDVIEAAEAHEIQEWFRIDGKAPFDPHA